MNLTTEQIEQIVKGAPVDDWTHYCTRNRQYFKRDGNTNMLLVWRSRTEAWSIPLVGKPRWLERREQLEENLTLRQRVQELEKQVPKWISVDDELPPIDTWVLWLDGNKTMAPYHSDYHIDKIDKRGECLVNYTHNYTHWMPLPQPPKGENDEL